MVSLQDRFQELRRERHRRGHERQERAAFGRLGRELAAAQRDPGDSPAILGLLQEIHARKGEIEALAVEEGVSIEADRADLARVASWVAPVVTCRGVCTRAVLRHRRASILHTLDRSYEALGRESRRLHGGTAPTVEPLAPSGLPAVAEWGGQVADEAMGFGRALWQQLRAHLVPKGPAVAGMVAGWWIANTYTDSHLRSVLHSVGIGSGGTHVVSGSTYRAMTFWLPLLAAALCAYVGERMARRWGLKAVKGER